MVLKTITNIKSNAHALANNNEHAPNRTTLKY